MAARLVRDVGRLITGAARANLRVASFAIDGQVRFTTAADRAAFAQELNAAVTALVARYHDETSPGGREHRLVVALHPTSLTAARPGDPDVGHHFELHKEITLAASPELVWDAIATGPGQLEVSRQTASRWHTRWQADGARACAAWDRQGAPRS